MSILHPDIRSIQAHNANETAFAVIEGSFVGNDIRIVAAPNLQLSQDWIIDPGIRQRIGEVAKGILGLKKAKLALSTFLRGTGTAAGDSTAALGAANLVEGQLLKNALGGESLGTGTTISGAGATTTVLPCTSVAGLAEGQAVMVGGEASVIGDITGSDVTLTRALSSAPADTTVVYGSATYYPIQQISGTLQFQVKGAEDDYWSVLGCQGVIKLANLNAGQLPHAQYDFTGISWVAHTGAAIANDSYTNSSQPSPIGYASSLYVQDYGTTTINEVNATGIAIDPGIANEIIPSASGIMGAQAYARSKIAPTIEYVTEYADDWRDDFEAQTPKYLHFQIGSTAGQTVLVEIPKWYISKSVERNAYNSQLGVKISGSGRDDTTPGTTDILQAAIRVHLL